MSNKIGYIRVIDTAMNPGCKKFEFREATFTRTINSRGDKIRSKMLISAVDYEEIVSNAQIMKDNPSLILTSEPFLLDDELREKCIKWVEWAQGRNSIATENFKPYAEKATEVWNRRMINET